MTVIYFAGPDVFRPDYAQHSQKVRGLCARYGLTPLLPDESHALDSPGIFQKNLDLILQADGVIANLNPFRGAVEPDSGTVFECGFAFARGKSVVGILADRRDLTAKLLEFGAARHPETGRLIHDGWLVEDFGLPLNLMLSHCLSALVGSLEEAVAAVPPPGRPDCRPIG